MQSWPKHTLLLSKFLFNKNKRFLLALLLAWQGPYTTPKSSAYLESTLGLDYKRFNSLVSFWEKKYHIRSIPLGAGHFEYQWLPEGLEQAQQLKKNAMFRLWISLFLIVICIAGYLYLKESF